jgi:uncharacterized secreted protein with C-terminal beta-propeller domain
MTTGEGPQAVAAPAPAKAPPESSSAGDSFSTTNVQEAAVDEPDVVKTDGKRIVTVSDNQLRVVDVTDPAAPKLVSSLPLEQGFDHRLLLRGDRVLVLSTSFGPIAVDTPPGVVRPASVALSGRATTLLSEVDISDPAAPKVARTMTLDGAFADARLTGGTARIVVTTPPQPMPLEQVAGASLRAWLPRTTIRSRITGRTYRRGVVPCDDVRHPAEFSGLDLLTVLTVDLDKGLYNVDRDAVMAGAETVYGTADSLYVASRRYIRGLQDTSDVPAGLRTEIHRFDASKPGETTYASSGSVPGFVLNQFALSEYDGALRVASTDEPVWLGESVPPDPSHSQVTVLKEADGKLVQVGHVGGLGEGERIYAVRFEGPVGYLVTFRQVDPLYTLDLSDASAPKVAGELKIAGYSAYLHPVGQGLLLGVGQDAGENGRVRGSQVSLFDVSDLAAPKLLRQIKLGDNASSDVEFDHHAFLFWPKTSLAVLPLTGQQFTGAVGLKVGRDALAEAGRVRHVDEAGNPVPVSRSLVIGDRLYTLSYLGLQVATLDTLTPTAFAAFPAG